MAAFAQKLLRPPHDLQHEGPVGNAVRLLLQRGPQAVQILRRGRGRGLGLGLGDAGPVLLLGLRRVLGEERQGLVVGDLGLADRMLEPGQPDGVAGGVDLGPLEAGDAVLHVAAQPVDLPCPPQIHRQVTGLAGEVGEEGSDLRAGRGFGVGAELAQQPEEHVGALVHERGLVALGAEEDPADVGADLDGRAGVLGERAGRGLLRQRAGRGLAFFAGFPQQGDVQLAVGAYNAPGARRLRVATRFARWIDEIGRRACPNLDVVVVVEVAVGILADAQPNVPDLPGDLDVCFQPVPGLGVLVGPVRWRAPEQVRLRQHLRQRREQHELNRVGSSRYGLAAAALGEPDHAESRVGDARPAELGVIVLRSRRSQRSHVVAEVAELAPRQPDDRLAGGLALSAARTTLVVGLDDVDGPIVEDDEVVAALALAARSLVEVAQALDAQLVQRPARLFRGAVAGNELLVHLPAGHHGVVVADRGPHLHHPPGLGQRAGGAGAPVKHLLAAVGVADLDLKPLRRRSRGDVGDGAGELAAEAELVANAAGDVVGAPLRVQRERDRAQRLLHRLGLLAERLVPVQQDVVFRDLDLVELALADLDLGRRLPAERLHGVRHVVVPIREAGLVTLAEEVAPHEPASGGLDAAGDRLDRSAPLGFARPRLDDEIPGVAASDAERLGDWSAVDQHLPAGERPAVALGDAAPLGEVEPPAVDLGALAGADGMQVEPLEAVRAAVVGRLEEGPLVGVGR